MVGEIIQFGGLNYQVKKQLGKGKSAYSWLCENGNEKIVLKQIHNEPCSYYQFQDKFKVEIDAYRQLCRMQIPLPEMLGFDEEKKWIFKEYIHGRTAAELIAGDKIEPKHFAQLIVMAGRARNFGYNLDFFPNNFIISCNTLYYIDYELNAYEDTWNLENWGLYYWVNEQGMKQFLETGNARFINEDIEKGIPYKNGFTGKVEEILQKWG